MHDQLNVWCMYIYIIAIYLKKKNKIDNIPCMHKYFDLLLWVDPQNFIIVVDDW